MNEKQSFYSHSSYKQLPKISRFIMMQVILATVILASLAHSQTDTNSTQPNEIDTFSDDYLNNSATTNTVAGQPSATPSNTTTFKVISGFSEDSTQQNATTVEGGEVSGSPEVAKNDSTEVNQVIYQSNTTTQGTSKDDVEEKYKILESK
jgi:hypothetical protein